MAGENPGGFIYFVVAKGGPVKIGFSTHPDQRLRTLQLTSPLPLKMIAKIRGTQSNERELHGWLKADRLHGEWFRRSDEVNRAIGVALATQLGPRKFAECLEFVEEELRTWKGANARA